MLKVKFQFTGFPEVVLHDHDEILRLLALRCVVQAELSVFKQIAVIRKQYEIVVQTERPLSVILEITDGVELRRQNSPDRFSVQRISAVSPFASSFGTGIVSTVNS